MLKKAGFIVSIASICILGVWSLHQFPFNNDDWLSHSNHYQQQIDNLEKVFVPGRDVLMAFRLKKEFFRQENKQQLQSFSSDIQELEEVLSLSSPLESTIVLNRPESLWIETYQEALEEGHFSLQEEYKEHFVQSMYHRHLLSKDLKTVLLVITLDMDAYTRDKGKKRKNVMSFIKKKVKDYPVLADYAISGDSAIHYYMDHETRSNLFWLLPLSTSLIIFLLWLLFRSVLKVIIMSTSVFLALVSCLGVIYVVSQSFNLVMIVLPLLIIVIVVADSIHVMTRWTQLKYHNKTAQKTLFHTFQQTWKPCLLTSITTAIGFGSFYFTEILPLQQLGLASAISIPLAYGVVMGSMYIWMNLFQDSLYSLRFKSSLRPSIPRQMIRAHYIVQNNLYKLLGLLIIGVCIGLFGVSKFKIETNFLDVFFQKSHIIQKDTEFMDSALLGTSGLDIVMTANEPDYFKSIEQLNQMKTVIARLKEHPLILDVQSYLNPLQLLHKELTTTESIYPQTDRQIEEEFFFLEFSRNDEKKDVLSEYIDFDYSTSRLFLKTENLNSFQIKQVIEFAQTWCSSLLKVPFHITGAAPFFDTLATYVLEAHLVSLMFSMGIIWIIMSLAFGLFLGTIGLLANIIPVVMVFGLIGLLKIPFDFATVLIGSISFGICVDDTIHFLDHYHRSKTIKITEKRVLKALRTIGSPVCYTTLLLSVGFGIFCTSSTVLLIKFGIFSIIAFSLALAMDLIFLPALLTLFEKRRSP